MEKKQLNDELIGQIAGYMRVGADFFLAAAACGVPERQAAEWKEKALAAERENAGDIYQELYERIRQAQAHAEVIALQRLSAEGGSAGAKWLLEKMQPQKYGKLGKANDNDKAKAQAKEDQADPGEELGEIHWETLEEDEAAGK
jgi:methionyl-tRNA synthetase